jgi:hypothetical protein
MCIFYFAGNPKNFLEFPSRQNTFTFPSYVLPLLKEAPEIPYFLLKEAPEISFSTLSWKSPYFFTVARGTSNNWQILLWQQTPFSRMSLGDNFRT